VEPSSAVSEIFEVIFAPDGKIYSDWVYETPIEQKPEPSQIKRTKKRKPIPVSSSGRVRYRSSSNNCGGGSNNSCGGPSHTHC